MYGKLPACMLYVLCYNQSYCACAPTLEPTGELLTKSLKMDLCKHLNFRRAVGEISVRLGWRDWQLWISLVILAAGLPI